MYMCVCTNMWPFIQQQQQPAGLVLFFSDGRFLSPLFSLSPIEHLRASSGPNQDRSISPRALSKRPFAYIFEARNITCNYPGTEKNRGAWFARVICRPSFVLNLSAIWIHTSCKLVGVRNAKCLLATWLSGGNFHSARVGLERCLLMRCWWLFLGI